MKKQRTNFGDRAPRFELPVLKNRNRRPTASMFAMVRGSITLTFQNSRRFSIVCLFGFGRTSTPSSRIFPGIELNAVQVGFGTVVVYCFVFVLLSFCVVFALFLHCCSFRFVFVLYFLTVVNGAETKHLNLIRTARPPRASQFQSNSNANAVQQVPGFKGYLVFYFY